MDDSDIISNLPRNVLDSILTYLPIRDAVRTSILSSKWRYAWVTIPNLTFSDECYLQFTGSPKSSTLASIVDQVLLLHSGPIVRFQILHYLPGFSSCVDRWILFLSRNGIKELFLEFQKADGDPYKVPSCLFSCEQLRLLALHHCILELPPDFKGFNHIRILDLQDISITEDTIDNLVSKCPLLRQLVLVYTIHLNSIRIHAPELKYLYLTGNFEDLCLVTNAFLTEAEIALTYPIDGAKRLEHGATCTLEKTLGCLVSIEKLVVDAYFMKFLAMGNVPERLPGTFDHLKYLFLNLNFQDSKELLATLCIFRSSPYLQGIEISVSAIKEDAILHEEHFWEERESLDCVFHHLEIIKLTGIHGEYHDLEFLKFVLANAPVLKKMSVSIDGKKKSEESRILKTLLRFQRASVTAEVIYLEQD